MFQCTCINLFQNGQSLLLLWHNNKQVYPPELSRIAGFCIIFYKKFSGGGPPHPPFKQNCLGLYYNHNSANHLKKLKTHTQISPPPTTIFSAELKIKWSLYVLFEKSIVDHFFGNVRLKEQIKVLEKSLKMYLKSPWKVLEKGMSWSVGTMFPTKVGNLKKKELWMDKTNDKDRMYFTCIACNFATFTYKLKYDHNFWTACLIWKIFSTSCSGNVLSFTT